MNFWIKITNNTKQYVKYHWVIKLKHKNTHISQEQNWRTSIPLSLMCENRKQFREQTIYCCCQFTGVTEAAKPIIHIKLCIAPFFRKERAWVLKTRTLFWRPVRRWLKDNLGTESDSKTALWRVTGCIATIHDADCLSWYITKQCYTLQFQEWCRHFWHFLYYHDTLISLLNPYHVIIMGVYEMRSCILENWYQLIGGRRCLVLQVSRNTLRSLLSCGSGSSVGIVTGYGLESPGSNSGGGEIFRTGPDRPWGPPSLLYNGYRVFPGGKAAGAWCWPPTPF
jgi:hypothetical protein